MTVLSMSLVKRSFQRNPCTGTRSDCSTFPAPAPEPQSVMLVMVTFRFTLQLILFMEELFSERQLIGIASLDPACS
ncbi:MAG: hypothetical protein PVSMB7_10950 [Chloroflexota bacterium]